MSFVLKVLVIQSNERELLTLMMQSLSGSWSVGTHLLLHTLSPGGHPMEHRHNYSKTVVNGSKVESATCYINM